MNIDIINRLDEITNLIENDEDLIKMKYLKKEILKDTDLIAKIEKIKTISNYDDNYLKLKKEINNNNNYKEFVRIENDTFLFIQSINKKLNCLREKRECL